MTPSHLSLGLSVPSLTLSVPSSSLPAGPADDVEGAPATPVDDADDDSGGWNVANPEAAATQFPFITLDDGDPDHDDLDELHDSGDHAGIAALPSPHAEVAATDAASAPHDTPPASAQPVLASPSLHPSLYAPLEVAEPSIPAAAASASPAADAQPALASSPTSLASSQHSLAPPSLLPVADIRLPLTSSQSSDVVLSIPSTPEPLSPSPPAPLSLHPSLPPLEAGTLDEEEEQPPPSHGQPPVVRLELDDSASLSRGADSGLLPRGAEGGRPRRDSQQLGSPGRSLLGKRRAGASSSLLSPPRSSRASAPEVAVPAMVRLPSVVTASQLLTDSQISEMMESQTFDGSLYQHTLPPSLQHSLEQLEHLQYQAEPEEDDGSEGVEVEEREEQPPANEHPQAALVDEAHEEPLPPLRVGDEVDSMPMALELDLSPVGDDGQERASLLRANAWPALSVKEEETESQDSLGGSFRLCPPPWRSTPPPRPSPPPSTAAVVSPTFSLSSSPLRLASPPRPSQHSSPHKVNEESDIGASATPRTRQRFSTLAETERTGGRGVQETAAGAVLSVDVEDEPLVTRLRERSAENGAQRGRSRSGNRKERSSRNGHRSQEKQTPPPLARTEQLEVVEGEDDEAMESLEVQLIDDDDDFVPVKGSIAAGKRSSPPLLRSSPRTSAAAKSTARHRRERQATTSRTPPSARRGSKRRSSERGDEEAAPAAEAETSKRSKSGTATPSTTRPSRESKENQAPSARAPAASSKSGAAAKVRQTSLTDFSFSSSSSSAPSEDDVFVHPSFEGGKKTAKPHPPPPSSRPSSSPLASLFGASYSASIALRRSAGRAPFADLTNVQPTPPHTKGRGREKDGGDGTPPWQMKRKRSGLISLRDEPLREAPESTGRLPATPSRVMNETSTSPRARYPQPPPRWGKGAGTSARADRFDLPFSSDAEVELVDSQ